MTTPTTTLNPSVEAIAHQYSREFFTQLTDLITKMRLDGNVKVGNPIFSEIEALVQEHTNIKIELEVDSSPEPNAWVYPPLVNENHALLGGWKGAADVTAIRRLFEKETSTYVSAGVDRLKGKVFGAFTKLKCKMALTTGLVNDKNYKDSEVAAILCHEIGHLMSFFEWFKRTVTINHVMFDTIMQFTQSDTMEERVLILKQAEKSSKIKINNKEYLAETNNPDLLPMVIITGEPLNETSAGGSYIHDMRTWEAMSDQYVARLGGGAPLASALDRMMRQGGHRSYRSTFVYLCYEIIKPIISVFFAVVTYGFYGLIMFCVFLSDTIGGTLLVDTYDRPGERLQRIRNELANSLKQRDIPAVHKTMILGDIAIVDKMLAQVKDRYSFYEKFVLFITPGNRRQRDLMSQQKQLEALSNNNLFVAGARLDTLA